MLFAPVEMESASEISSYRQTVLAESEMLLPLDAASEAVPDIHARLGSSDVRVVSERLRFIREKVPSMIRMQVIILIAFFLVLDVFDRKNIDLVGDGVEYLMMTESIHDHGSPDLRPDDVARAKDRNSRFATNASWIIEHAINLDAISYGYIKALNGKFYSYQFWLYPLVNVPAFDAMRALKLPPTLSFPITNTLGRVDGIPDMRF